MSARRIVSRWAVLSCVVAVSPLLAQDQPANEPKDATAQAEKKIPAPDKSAPAPSSTREFKPSEEVSPDQEVDFPADL